MLTVGKPPILRYVARVEYAFSVGADTHVYELSDNEHGIEPTLAGYTNPYIDDPSEGMSGDMSGAGLGRQFETPEEAQTLLNEWAYRASRYPNLYHNLTVWVAEVDIRRELEDLREELLRQVAGLDSRLEQGI